MRECASVVRTDLHCVLRRRSAEPAHSTEAHERPVVCVCAVHLLVHCELVLHCGQTPPRVHNRTETLCVRQF